MTEGSKTKPEKNVVTPWLQWREEEAQIASLLIKKKFFLNWIDLFFKFIASCQVWQNGFLPYPCQGF